MQAEVALHSAGPLLNKVSLIAEEPTLMERVALMLHPSFALKGKPPSFDSICSFPSINSLQLLTYLLKNLQNFLSLSNPINKKQQISRKDTLTPPADPLYAFSLCFACFAICYHP